jgi:hypothetical protein
VLPATAYANEQAALPKSNFYTALLPLINSKRIDPQQRDTRGAGFIEAKT